MFHSENQKIRDLLFKGNFGLEKESLRIKEDGSLSHTSHPFRGHKHIVYDFCENQVEVNTDVATSIEEAIENLKSFNYYIIKELSELDPPELLWPFSNPSYIKNEEDIPIGKHVDGSGYNDGYREYLGERYGRYKMSLSGIHYNFSFAEELIQEEFGLSGKDNYSEFKNKIYLELAEKLSAYGWIITAIAAASPIIDGSFIEKGDKGRSVFNGMASTRCSELGYWNHFTPLLDYEDIRTYADSIKKYVDLGLIAAPTELYYPIRLKPAGKNNLKRLHDEGVGHIEIRVVDLFPFDISGVNLPDMKFIHLLIVWLASTPYVPLTKDEKILATQNFKNAAHYDLNTVKILIPNEGTYYGVDAGLKIIEQMKDFYSDFSEKEKISEILSFEEAKFKDANKRYAWQIRQDYDTDFVIKGIELAKQQQKKVLSCVNYSDYPD